jgi:hypothetical protein
MIIIVSCDLNSEVFWNKVLSCIPDLFLFSIWEFDITNCFIGLFALTEIEEDPLVFHFIDFSVIGESEVFP